jgi:hypothetical protein
MVEKREILDNEDIKNKLNLVKITKAAERK